MPADSLDFSAARVLVAGDLLLDRYWHGSTTRISPEAPVPVVRIGRDEVRPGGAGNVAGNVAALGGRVELVAATGDDDQGRLLADLLGAAGVQCRLHTRAGGSTIVKLRVMSQHQQLIRLDFEDSPEPVPPPAIQALVEQALDGCNVMVISDYAKGTLADVAGLVKAARAAGVMAIVDPKGADFQRYRGATVLTPNLREFEAVVGDCADEARIAERGLALIESLDLQALLVTRGEAGMTLLRRDGVAAHMPAEAREVFDVTGAGDTVCAVLASALSAGADLARAARLANIAAGIAVGRLGAVAVSAADIESALHGSTMASTAPLAGLDEAVALRQAARHRGERVVFTNGCFDVLHAGHVRYLQQARALGDRLVVAVNDDASVRRLKGEDRPLVPLAQRMAVLAALGSVDWVIAFSADTPLALIEALGPDILVKGGDYSPDTVVGADCVRASGGQVRVLPFLDGVSSTAIIQRAAASARPGGKTQ